MQRKGIDVSKHNGVVDWAKVKASGIEFAIIRTGYGKDVGTQVDEKFEQNYTNAKAVGLPIGVYHFSYATTPAEAIEEAQFCLKIIKGKQFEYPIYFDIEAKCHYSLTKEQNTAIVMAFCTELEKAGYWAGVYSFDSFYQTYLSDTIQTRYTCWVARVENIKPTSCKKYDVWQYSWKGKIDGITTDTDLNYCYRDFPTIIKNAKKNGYNVVQEPKYNISATINNISESESIALISNLTNLGMTVEKEKI